MTKQDLKNYLHNKAEYEYEELDDMSPIQLLAAWCNWEGLLGNWADEIVRVVEATYNIKLKNE